MKYLKAVILQLFAVCFFLSCFLCSRKLAAQQARYSRFQYHQYTWKHLPTGLFHLYFPAGYDSLCRFASLHLPDIATAVLKSTGIELNKVPNIIIYPSPDQLYESNIGLYENTVQTFPTVNLKGNRVLVAFNGSYEDLRRELAESWVRLSWEDMFKAGLEEQLTNRQALMPRWFKEGCIRYFAAGWPVEAEDQVMNYIGHGITEADSFKARDPELYGQAFCYFLSIRYRKDAARQIVAQLRQGKSLGRASRLVTKQIMDTLQQQCIRFYQQRHAFFSGKHVEQERSGDALLEKTAAKAMVLLKLPSPDTQYMAFVTDNGFRRSVFISQVKGNHGSQKIHPLVHYDLPPWIDNHRKDRYPLISWEANNRHLLITFPEKGKIKVRRYTAEGILTDTRVLYGVDGINDIYDWQGGWMMAAFRKAQGDIVFYHSNRSAYTALTSDLADNKQLAVDSRRLSIAYRSGYPADSLMPADSLAKDYGIYSKVVNNISEAAKQHEKVLKLDSTYITWTQPGYDTDNSITAIQTSSGTQERQMITTGTGLYTTDASPWLHDYARIARTQDSLAQLKQRLQENNISLLGNILEPGNTAAAAKAQHDSVRRALAYHPRKVRPYILQLYSAYFTASINNDYYINRYQPYKAYLGSFKFPEVGAMVQGGFSDLFDNHHFNIGYRMPSGADGSDFFFRYEYTARKLDWHWMYFRKAETLDPDPDRNWLDKQGQPYPVLAKVKTYYYELGFCYPLHYDWSLSLDIAARNDKTIFPATDRRSLQYDNLHQWWNINTLSLHAHKLHPTIPMLFKGWEGKATLDGMLADGAHNATLLYGSVFKIAYHRPLYKKITAVVQAQAGHSGGRQKILYNFGGLDNNVVPRTDTTVRFSEDAPYAFQSLVTPLRGYRQNSIYGNTFGLVNMDVYFPLFAELLPLHTSFNMINQLQLGVFCDAVLAGRDEHILPATPSHLFACGLSARTMLAGYGIRFDIAWPGDFGKQPVWYLSLLL